MPGDRRDLDGRERAWKKKKGCLGSAASLLGCLLVPGDSLDWSSFTAFNCLRIGRMYLQKHKTNKPKKPPITKSFNFSYLHFNKSLRICLLSESHISKSYLRRIKKSSHRWERRLQKTDVIKD